MLRCQCAILAEHIRPGLRNTFDILGVFDRIFARGLPIRHRRMALAILLVANGEDDLGKHSIVLRCLSPTGQLLLEQHTSFDLKPEAGNWLGSARFAFQFDEMLLPEYGRYQLRVDVDGLEVASHRLMVTPENAAEGTA